MVADDEESVKIPIMVANDEESVKIPIMVANDEESVKIPITVADDEESRDKLAEANSPSRQPARKDEETKRSLETAFHKISEKELELTEEQQN
ncbi:unnamed protein product [Toxocara canis]|uniref:TMV resistance protein N-like n=1 Tax=Toxocara canis TaxID=6265 RepID=A0A183TY77_TOXCA|nr:unnamed protein product [Toxocara canis]